ncbi:MAG: hypothetical protein NT133_04150 [Alphaproteobacteria bacterium]|nr:hypothetical protein [Alphaproteobacteria bacterium]
MPAADPTCALAWAATRVEVFDAAMAEFMGWPDPRTPIIPDRGCRAAVVIGDRTWCYDALPDWVTQALAEADAVALAVHHMLLHETRPDDTLVWQAGHDDRLGLGALYVGATVHYAEPPSFMPRRTPPPSAPGFPPR